MKKLILSFAAVLLFVSCVKIVEVPTDTKKENQTESTSQKTEEKKAVEKEIDILFKGEKMTKYSNSSGQHPWYATCRIRTYSDCPELKIYYRHSEEDEWTLGKTSADAVSISSTKIELNQSVMFYPKKSIYFMITMNGENISSFGKWLPTDDWNYDYEHFYTVYE